MKKSESDNENIQSYLIAGQRWEDDIFKKLRRSRSLAWLITIFFGVITFFSLLALVLLVPLKTFEPYVISVDKTTGFVEVTRALKVGDLDQNEAVSAANLVRYIRARETYDPRALKDNYDMAQLYSTGEASNDLKQLYEPSNPNSLDKLYGRDTKISVNINAISFLNKTTASVRFSTTTKKANSEKIQYWVAVVKFRYTSTPLKNEYRFDNPLGFQVYDYRRDQESVTPEAEKK